MSRECNDTNEVNTLLYEIEDLVNENKEKKFIPEEIKSGKETIQLQLCQIEGDIKDVDTFNEELESSSLFIQLRKQS